MREINLDIIRVTEAAAIAASVWIGSGDKLSADKSATEAMRDRLNRIDCAAQILIGEGKKDESYGLFKGEKVGLRAKNSNAAFLDLAVDPIDGTRPTITSGPEAVSVLAVGEPGSLFTTEEFYMHKLAYGPEIASKVQLSINEPLTKIIERVSAATGKPPSRIMVCVLDRPRHEAMITELRRLGVRIKLIQDCDVSGAIAACLPESGIDLMFGIGGAPEGVIAAVAIKCLRGDFQGQIVDKNWKPVGSKIYGIKDLVKGECAFAATGVTNGSLLRGVRYTSHGPVTHSVFMRSESGTVRWLETQHGNA